ncbi:secreted RxLR effector protein 161-like [Impatiens glandulifera]|uniref:secreted RxLR effector protein 161-like n=1 Tax=Impatiens glandulifera TaxID=253017 RepID=UPI001FB099D9|nr:secreted RxLR effector protein 161-like [Impatiens glandulifera]
MEDDPINFQQAIDSSNSPKWIDAMNEEYKSMQDNKVWELVPLLEGVKPVGCKWIFKTKRDSKDIAYIVGVLGRYLSNLGLDHLEAVKRLMRYLKRTRSYMITYRRSDNIEIIGYSDSDFAGCQDSLRSTSGYVFLLAGGAISWKSSKQGLTTSSTMVAEFVACYEASNQAIWLKNFVTELHILKRIEKTP